ncbi:helix-turn-helix domain-containing protein [Streptomyces sp. IBSBF 2507]|uniref:helix-turn-helix domain-containing protein n=1 Tax=Streptomyces sp. IBSBF 2507 TaxID=2903530 RepID=UPI00351E8752
MRYAQGGGLTDERRAFREKLRMEAAERFRQGDENTVIAHDLRVSVRSVQRWRKAWSQDGTRALASKGPASLPLLSERFQSGHRSGDGGKAATHEAPMPLREVFDVSTHQRRCLVGSLSCRTRPAACAGRVGHHAHRHPRG